MSGMSDRDAFAMFDTDGDGAINALELSHALYAMGCNPTVKECEAMAAQCPDSARIDFATFQQILRQAPRPDSSAQQHLLEAFRVFDKNEDGKIPENDLRVIFTTLGETCDLQVHRQASRRTGTNRCSRRRWRSRLEIAGRVFARRAQH
jgi:Ca2+-binding EF-hand superfamily protein